MTSIFAFHYCTTALNAADRRMDSGGKPSVTQIVVLATSSALTAVFYAVYRSRATAVARLKVSDVSATSSVVLCDCVDLLPVMSRLLIGNNFSQEAKKVAINQDLKAILSETPGRCVPYAVIEGESVI